MKTLCVAIGLVAFAGVLAFSLTGCADPPTRSADDVRKGSSVDDDGAAAREQPSRASAASRDEQARDQEAAREREAEAELRKEQSGDSTRASGTGMSNPDNVPPDDNDNPDKDE